MMLDNRTHRSVSPCEREYSFDILLKSKSRFSLFKTENPCISNTGRAHIENYCLNEHSRNSTAFQIPMLPVQTSSYSKTRHNSNEITCLSCLRFEKELESLRAQLKKTTEKIVTTEKHVKQYESLLRIKDTRLTEKESNLNYQFEELEQQSQRLIKEKEDFYIEKEKIEKDHLSQTYEIEKIKQKLKTQENDLEAKKSMINKEQTRIEEEILAIEKLKNVLKQQEECICEEKQMLQQHYAEKLKEVEEIKQTTELRLKNFEYIYKNNTKSGLELSLEGFDDISFGKMEYSESIEGIKDIFQSKQGSKIVSKCCSRQEKDVDGKSINDEGEIFGFDESLIFAHEWAESTQKPLNLSDDPRGLIRLTIPSAQKLMHKYEATLLHLQENIKLKDVSYNQENERIKAQVAELKSENSTFQNQIQTLQLENSNLLSKTIEAQEMCKVLQSANQKLIQKYGNADDLDLEIVSENHGLIEDMVRQLEIKLKVVLEKEQNLKDRENALVIEENDVRNTADCLKLMYEDIENDKCNLMDDKYDFFDQKAAVVEMEKKQKEKNDLLMLKEKELIKLKEELIEKERLITAKLYRMPTRNFKRLNTHLDNFLEKS
ncbi:hypothetical protein SteCoe_19657 [Stentor coeruleus]|uniref:Uncharacterized protein n=1 Tax=Stentor coeruleus TaxID=5963 RepID=A0A1R2BTY7_9CILI|nr:hypothetical protein SteCoe_19657 [Stentor coeruleus]